MLTQPPVDPSIATVWLTHTGLIICVSKNFSDLQGYRHQDVSGRPFKMIMASADEADQLMLASEPLALGQTSAENFPIHLKHKFGEVVNTTCTIHIAGTETARIVAIDLKLTEQAKAAIFTVTGAG